MDRESLAKNWSKVSQFVPAMIAIHICTGKVMPYTNLRYFQFPFYITTCTIKIITAPQLLRPMAKRSAIREYGEKKVPTNLYLTRKTIARLDAIAKAINASRSDTIDRFILGYELPNIDIEEPENPDEELKINTTLAPTTIAKLQGWAKDINCTHHEMLERLVLRQFIIKGDVPTHHEGQFQLQLLSP